MSKDNTPLPPELDWEQMEAGIMEKMAALEATELSVKEDKDSKSRFIVIIPLLFILASIVLFFFKQEHNPTASQQKNTPSEKTILTPTSSNDAQVAHNSKTVFTEQDASEIANDIENATDAQKAEKNGIFQITTPQPINQATNTASVELKSVTTKQKQNIQKAEGRSNNESKFITEQQNKTPGLVSTNVIERNQSTLSTFLPLRNQFITIDSDANPTLLLIVTNEQDTESISKKVGGRIDALSGVSIWSIGYGNNSPERKDYESSLLSYNAQLNYIHPLKNGFSVLIGLQYQQLESRFDWNERIEDYNLTLVDTIVQIQINALTQERTEIRGDVQLTVAAERVVRHYNTTRLFQLPIAIGKSWSSKKWQKDIFIGSAINLATQNTGRTRFNGAIVDYDGATTNFIDNQWKLSAFIAGRLTYKLNDHLGLTTNLQFQKGLSNWSTESTINIRPNVFSAELGFSYYW